MPNKAFKVARLEAEVPDGDGSSFWTAWEGYDQTFDTKEPAKNVLDDSLVSELRADRDVTINLDQAIMMMREAVAVDMIKKKYSEGQFEVEVPALAFPALAHAVLRRLARARSCVGQEPLELEFDKGDKVQTTTLELQLLEDIGGAVSLHLVRPEAAFGAALVKKGRASSKKIFIIGPPFTARCALAARTPPLAPHAPVPPQLHAGDPARRRPVRARHTQVHGGGQPLGAQRLRRQPRGDRRRAKQDDAQAARRVPQEHPPWAQAPRPGLPPDAQVGGAAARADGAAARGRLPRAGGREARPPGSGARRRQPAAHDADVKSRSLRHFNIITCG